MKTITPQYKENIKLIGKQIDSKITYTIEGVNYELGADELNSITPHYKSNILKSVMKQLDIDSNVNIPLGTILNYQFGVLVNNQYEYINYGNYIVYSSEKQEDLNSYKIVCYDKMLYAMKDYESFATYPITIRDYIDALATHLGLTFKNSTDSFVNYNRTIPSELYLDANGGSLDYTFRDVLDELAQVTASTICINELTDELEVRYINDTNDTIDEEYFKDINVKFGEKFGPINTISFKRSAESDVISKSYPEDLPDEDKKEISIVGNQILNDNNRADYLDEILNQLKGLEYYINDYTSTGITFYEMCDRYNAKIGENTYSCIMFNDETLVTQGLQENVFTEMPKESVTDYNTSSKDDRSRNRTNLIVDKVNQRITSEISSIEDIRGIIIGTYSYTGDEYFEDNKTYYILNQDGDYIEYTNYNVGDPIPPDTIYELTDSIIERVDENISGLQDQINLNTERIQNLRQETSSQFEQTNSSFEFALNNITTIIDQNNEEVNLNIEEIRKYLRYENGILTLGVSNNPFLLRLRNDRIYFEQNGNEVAYISNNTLYITDGHFLNQLRIGNFAFIPRSNGSLGFRKVV